MGDRIKVGDFGNLSIGPNDDAPLLIVFGGKNVDGRDSGDYMWDFMSKVQNKFHIFVALSQHVDGWDSFDALMTLVNDQGLTPSHRILYLFSGGWWPGLQLIRGLQQKNLAIPFSAIFLVDIWMKSATSSDFYTHLPNKISNPITYVYTSGGAVNNEARNMLVKSLPVTNSKLVKPKTKDEDDMVTHMSTNTVAVGLLP